MQGAHGERVLILAAGIALGSALTYLPARRGHSATLWHTHTGAVRGDRTPWTPDTPAAAHPALRV